MPSALDSATADATVIWPDPEPLDGVNRPEAPYPLGSLPPIVADAVREYQAYGQQPLPIVACSALAATSLVTQGLADIARDDGLSGPISIYTLAVAVSGERKTSADREFIKPIRDWAIDRREAAKPDLDRAHAASAAWAAEREGLISRIRGARAGSGRKKSIGAEVDIDALKTALIHLEEKKPAEPIVPYLFYEDTNPAALAVDLAEGWPSASLWSDEAGLVIGSQGMGEDSLISYIGLLNRLWDGSPFERRRRTTKSVTIKGRRFTVALMMQPVVLRRMLAAGAGVSRGMGLIARYCMAWPTSTIGFRPYRAPTEGTPAMRAMHRRMIELLDLPLPTSGPDMALEPPALRLSGSAFTVWRDYYNEIETELSRWGEFGDIPDIGAKIAENAARFAGQFHVFNNGPVGEVEESTITNACTVASWHLAEAKRLIGATELPPAIEHAKLLLEWMLRQPKSGPHQLPGPFELRRISQFGPAPVRGKDERDAAVEVLIETRHLVKLSDNKLHLNPKLMAGAK